MKRLAVLLVVALAVLAAPPAHAQKARVVWTEIRMPSREARPSLLRHLREVVERQTRRADWGSDGTIEAEIEVTELTVVVKADVVRVTCAGRGRVTAGPRTKVARSRFSMGGRPRDEAALKKQLLTMLGRGLVTRLADIARSSR